MAFNLQTFITRTITATVFVAVLLTCICVNFYSLAGLFFIVSVWGLYEFYQISRKFNAQPNFFLGIFLAILLYLSVFLSLLGDEFFIVSSLVMCLAVLVTSLIFIQSLFQYKENPIQNLAFTFLGIIYAVVPFLLIIKTTFLNSQKQFSFDAVLGMILLIWANDASAYIIGSFFGKHKLYERISPGKTWEGTIGAAVLTILCAIPIHFWFPEIKMWSWMIIACIVAFFGTVGDLIESMIKRQAGIKDSGKIMPGHGGILDRFDSLIFVAPIVYMFLSLILKL
jgi:phosphatidate cytidylyltransferase